MAPIVKTIILVFLILLLISSFPLHGFGFGYYGEGSIGAVLLICVVLVLADKL